jgi:glycosyltransferase involved in cell wall biosynthesis
VKIALVHDYLIDFGGAERVLLALHETYPDAPIYTSIVDKKGMGNSWKYFENLKVKTSWFNKIPFAPKLISPLRFLLPFIWANFDLSKFDLIIDSSSWAITRGFKTRKGQIEICYCHTPPRYLYGYDTSRNWNKLWYGNLIKIYALVINKFMRYYDFRSAQKVDHFIANSKNVQSRIKKFYNRDSIVIYPPVEVAISDTKYNIKDTKYFLTGGRLVSAKNFDLIIKACKKVNIKLKIFGTGILENDLKKIAGENTQFLGKVSDEELAVLYKNAFAFLASQKDEDFGITTIEANSVGCPVIAYRGGGYLETVIENKTGIFFEDLTIESLIKAINKFKKTKWNKKVIMDNAKRFSRERFEKEIKDYVKSVV